MRWLFVKLNDMKSDFILDSDTETEVIYLHHEEISNGMFYFKHKYLKYDFRGNEIKDPHDYIRTNSLFYIDLDNKNKVEVISFGDFDINYAMIIGNYLYFIKVTDKDNDGSLKDDYYSGDIYRINLKNFQVEYCCDTVPYIFHGFELATERYVVFRSEDRIPDTSEIIFIDLENKKKAIFTSSWDEDELNHKFIYDEKKNPIYIVAKKFVSEGTKGSKEDKLMCFQ